MIKFFRKIRQKILTENKFSKYLLYALGEIALVVIGILLALQVNTWNEGRKANNEQKVILTNLLQDLMADSIAFSVNMKTLSGNITLQKRLYEIGVADKTDLIIENPEYIRRGLAFNPITGDNDPFIANKISNESIRDEILVYLRYVKSMQGVGGNLGEVVRAIRQYLGEQKAHSLSGWFENPTPIQREDIRYDKLIESDVLMALAKTPEFQQLLIELSLKTTESMVVLRSVIEQNLVLMEAIRKELDNNTISPAGQ